MSAPGSATMRSPSDAYEARTPPVVGSVMTLTYGMPASSRRASAETIFPICISAIVPSCMRSAPGERALRGARDLLAHDAPHRSTHELEVHDDELHGIAADRRGAGDGRVLLAALGLRRDRK